MKYYFSMLFLLVVGAAANVTSLPAHAQNMPWKLVCFGREGLAESLDKVINAQQFLRSDRILKSGRCDFAQIPPNSTARFSGFHETSEGFIFPTFQVRYSTTKQRMYAADGVFLSSAWRVSTRLRECRTSKFLDVCLFPRSCQSLDGLLSLGQVPAYVGIPDSCRTFRTK